MFRQVPVVVRAPPGRGAVAAARHTRTIAYEPWPAHDEAKLARDTMVIAVQVGGKLRGQSEVAPDAAEPAVLAAAQADAKVQTFLAGKPVKKAI
jgi:leucyl-tRNA synthetase